ncbi:MAG TPA: XrtA system polysaccharide deacetylase [Planctomycetaceae bacterium]|jgi:polysaccharide deacetylase family protein (PEP-CTERM system associated)
MPTDQPLLNAFTVDVEDYYHVAAFAENISTRDWDLFESHVVENTHRVLKLLNEYQVRGTFFILGWVADRYPGLVTDILKHGHEIGCHSFWHRLVYEMTPADFREDLLQAAKAIEQTTGEPVRAYRAPSFSVTAKSLWALDVLIEEGFTLDASIFPIRHDRYGIPDAERFPHVIQRKSGTILEFPASVHRLWKMNLPISGGGYFRLYPITMTLKWLAMINRRHRQPFVFYIHPWELDCEQPLMGGSVMSRWRHYQNIARTEEKLHTLLRRFRFGTLSEALASAPAVSQPSFIETHQDAGVERAGSYADIPQV